MRITLNPAKVTLMNTKKLTRMLRAAAGRWEVPRKTLTDEVIQDMLTEVEEVVLSRHSKENQHFIVIDKTNNTITVETPLNPPPTSTQLEEEINVTTETATVIAAAALHTIYRNKRKGTN